MTTPDRRAFLSTAAAAASVAIASRTRAASASSEVVLAIMGANNRGSQLAKTFGDRSDVRIAYICDPDELARQKGVDAVMATGAAAPKAVSDFRRALDDASVDGIICAAPNHWHAPATILACAAGKHVYVEKPASHSADEGERMVAAARSSGRVVQVGMQRRSGPLYREVVEKVRGGAIGDPLLAKSWYHVVRPSVGRGQTVEPPARLDYDLWQGPAPAVPYRDNVIHYNWHFFWHWGDGELGNNGVHTIDICRWALGVDVPTRVTMAGSRVRYDDDQETPDTANVIFECGDKMIAWENVSWIKPYQSRSSIGIEIRGTEGTLVVDDDGGTIYDPERKVIEHLKGSRGDAEHAGDFIDAVRDGHRTNADIEEGHKSALFCHLGNIAYRTRSTLEVDGSGRIIDNAEAQSLWAREYRPGWMPAQDS